MVNLNSLGLLLSLILISIFSSSCTHLFYHPDRFKYTSPKVMELDYFDVPFKSEDGTNLHAWYIPPKGKEKKDLILFFHGNAQNLSSHFTNISWACKKGFGVLIFDYRGYGLSNGTPSPKTTALDGMAAFDLAKKYMKNEKYRDLVLYGQSLGGAILLKSLEVYKKELKPKLVVLDSTFTNYQNVAFDILKNNFFTFIFSPLAYLFVSGDGNVDKVPSNIKAPTLVIHGKYDQVVPFKHGKQIYESLGNIPKKFWEIPYGLHTDVFFRHEGEYRQKFIELLNNVKTLSAK